MGISEWTVGLSIGGREHVNLVVWGVMRWLRLGKTEAEKSPNIKITVYCYFLFCLFLQEITRPPFERSQMSQFGANCPFIPGVKPVLTLHNGA